MITTDWTLIENDPDFQSLPPDRQRALRIEWVERMTRAGGPASPEDLKKRKARYEAVAFASVPREQWPTPPTPSLYERVFGFPSPTIGEVLSNVERIFTTPQQAIASALHRPPTRTGVARLTTPFKEAFAHVTGERPYPYPYHWYADPMMARVVGGIVYGLGRRYVTKKMPTLTKEVKELFRRQPPPSPTQPGLPWGEIPGRVPPLKTVGPPRPLTPTPTPKGAIQTLRVHFTPMETAQIRQFVRTHPNDAISQALKSGKPLTDDLIEEIQRRILQPRAGVYRSMPTAEAARARIEPYLTRRPPPPTSQPSTTPPSPPEALNMQDVASYLDIYLRGGK